jgi:hypothetical protein
MFKLFNLFNWVTDLVESFTFYGGGGKGGGGGGGGNTTQTSYSTNLPEYAKPYYEELLKQSGKQIYATDSKGNVTGVKEFTPYTGERIAGLYSRPRSSTSSNSSTHSTRSIWCSYNRLRCRNYNGSWCRYGWIKSSIWLCPAEISGGMFTPGAASYYANPYQQNVTDIALRQASLQGAKDKTAGALGAMGRGTFGGARQALQAEQLNQQGQQYQAGIGKDIGLAGLTAGLQGSQALGALGATQQASDVERLKAQAASAGETQALQQERLNQQYQQFMDQQNYQKAQLDYLSNILRGNAGALGSTQVAYAPAPSVASQLGGLGLAGLGLYNVLGNKG